MEFSDELIACYIEGKANAEERNFVREYLSKHPEEYECILHMMDNDSMDYNEKETEDDNYITMNAAAISDIAYSAAAFAPMRGKLFHPKNKPKIKDTNEDLYERLRKMNAELDEIL